MVVDQPLDLGHEELIMYVMVRFSLLMLLLRFAANLGKILLLSKLPGIRFSNSKRQIIYEYILLYAVLYF